MLKNHARDKVISYMKTVAKKRMLIIILWLVYIAIAGGLLYHFAYRSNVKKTQRNLLAQGESVVAQLPAILENAMYSSIASLNMRTSKLEALAFALDDKKAFEGQKALLDDFVSEADVAGLAVYDENGEALYITEGQEELILTEELLHYYLNNDSREVFSALRGNEELLRKFFFSPESYAQPAAAESEESEDSGLEAFGASPEESPEESSDVSGQRELAHCKTENDRWLLISSNVMSETEAKVRSKFDWRESLKSIRIGNNGFLIAIDEDTGFVYASGAQNLTYESSEEVDIRLSGVDHEPSIEEIRDAFSETGKIIRITYGEEPCYAVRLAVDDVLLLAVVPEAEARATLSGSLYVRLLLFFVMSAICVLYVWFLLADKEGKVFRHFRRFAWNRSYAGRLAACAMIVTAVTFACGLFLEILTAYADAISYTSAKVVEGEIAYLQNTHSSEDLQTWFEEEYLDRCRTAKVIMEHAGPKAVDWAYLDELAQSLGVMYIYQFDDQGNIVATNSSYDRITLRKGDPFYALLEGRAEMTQPLEKDALTGETLLKAGVSERNDRHVCTGMVLIAADAVEQSRIMDNIGARNMFRQLCLTEGSKMLVLSGEDLTVRANAETLNGAYVIGFDGYDCTGAPFKSVFSKPEKLEEDYNGKMFAVNRSYYISSTRNGELYFLTLSPQHRVSAGWFGLAGLAAAIVLFFLLVLAVIACLEKEEAAALMEEAQDAAAEDAVDAALSAAPADPSPVRKKRARRHRRIRTDQEVIAVFDRLMNRKKPYFEERWPNDVVRWKEKSPSDKFAFMLKATLLFAFAAIYVNALVAKEESLWYYVLSGEWDAGVNLHSITACISYICLLLIVKMAVHKGLFVLARALDSGGETVCHLLDSASGYVIAAAGIFLCLAKFGVDARSLSLTAGVAGVIFSIGCQSIVADILAGFLMAFEGNVLVGDFLMFNDKPEVVLSIGIRTTRLKFFNDITIVRNNDFRNFVLRPGDKECRMLATVTIDQTESLRRVEDILAEELPKILDRLAAIAGSPIGPLKYSGVSRISANGVELEFQLYCEGRYYMTLFRELNRELKLLCEDHEIAIAMNQVMMYEPKTDSEEKPEDA